MSVTSREEVAFWKTGVAHQGFDGDSFAEYASVYIVTARIMFCAVANDASCAIEDLLIALRIQFSVTHSRYNLATPPARCYQSTLYS
jgi:hypothetical protein